jgi:hypothetical protein
MGGFPVEQIGTVEQNQSIKQRNAAQLSDTKPCSPEADGAQRPLATVDIVI